MTLSIDEFVSVDIDAGLAVLTVRRDSLNRAVKEQLAAAIIQIQRDADVRAVLIRSAGRHFCVGQDLAEHIAGLDDDPAHAMDTVEDHYNPLIRGLAAVQVPVVAAISGACVGAGLGIALAADIRVVGEGATFATAFTGIGLASDSGLSHSLVAALGESRTLGLFLLGDRVGATDALAWGLVHKVVPDSDVADAAYAVARRLADGPTAAYTHVKRLVRTAGLDDALDGERDAQVVLGQTADHREAVDAFLAKRKPFFTGR